MSATETRKSGGATGWLFGGLKKEEDTETLSSSDERWRTTPAPSGRDNQRGGGPLDQVGLDAAEGKKKGVALVVALTDMFVGVV
ncbi:hypothetical protein NUW58_g10689 [Xylaria curta]|uniref:Uncharacterized protein n=1 Tax=Xylaria curta TaxID=42375 RepID=A0ACC1MI28_9PEZI|nr:hypothetical protein NUW58_g10689 [Xylaria curta]